MTVLGPPAALNETFLPGGATHGRVSLFYHFEADLLDSYRFADWLDLLHEEIAYEMPVRSTTLLVDGDGFQDTNFFLENLSSLTTRVRRLETNFAWAETPPSRSRHFVTNVLIETQARDGTLSVRSNLLLNRTRAEGGNQTLTASRRDQLVPDPDCLFRIKGRRVLLDQTVVSATNLSLFF